MLAPRIVTGAELARNVKSGKVTNVDIRGCVIHADLSAGGDAPDQQD
jgi:hypothetical protein